jgi:hypothetical protein
MRIISTLFLVTAVATALQPPESYDENHLRGANTGVYKDRDLSTNGVSPTTISFSFASSAASNQLCFDYNAVCLELGNDIVMTDAEAATSGNAFAIAFAEEELWLTATCRAYAHAYSQVCAFTKVDGQIVVDSKMVRRKRNVSLKVSLNTATTTFAMATAVAVAEAYTEIDAKSFTSVAAFCAEVGNMSPLCAGGTASTDLKQIAQADARTAGQGFAVAESGSSTSSSAALQTQGNELDFVKGNIVAYAKSWSFAKAGAAADAFAKSISSVANKSFAEVCIAEHGKICDQSISPGEGICSKPADEACANAVAKGEAHAEALSIACVKAFINAYAETETLVFLSANVDCKSKPKLTWTCTDAGVGQSCIV